MQDTEMISFTKEEVIEILEQLSFRPYREVESVFQGLARKLVEAEEAEQRKPKIEV